MLPGTQKVGKPRRGFPDLWQGRRRQVGAELNPR